LTQRSVQRWEKADQIQPWDGENSRGIAGDLRYNDGEARFQRANGGPSCTICARDVFVTGLPDTIAEQAFGDTPMNVGNVIVHLVALQRVV
jgi:hypothetical protein